MNYVSNQLIIISIVIPTYNRKDFVKIAIDSALLNLNENLFKLNIIVVDDGSTDGTDSHLEKYIIDGKISFLKIKNSERGAARNHGARFAINQLNTDYILFFDADDILQSNAILTFYKNIIAQPEIKCFFAQFQILTEKNTLTAIAPKIKWPLNIRKHVVEKEPLLPLGCTVIHHSVYTSIGGFVEDRELSGSEDWIFLFQIILNHKISYIPLVTTQYRQHIENTNAEKFNQSIRTTLKRINEQKNNWNITDQEIYKLTVQFQYNLIGVHNSQMGGQPFCHLYNLIINYPAQMLKPKFYFYFLSVCRRSVIKLFFSNDHQTHKKIVRQKPK